MVACKQWHDLPADMSTPFEGQYQSHATLTPTTWTLIRMTERTDDKGKFNWDFVKTQCMHCGDPACAKGCPEEAIDKLASGAVVINEEKCVGCGYCVTACPYDARWMHPKTGLPVKCMGKGCESLLKAGKDPACVAACPASARAFGDINDPSSAISQRLQHGRSERLMPQKGTRPNFFVVVNK